MSLWNYVQSQIVDVFKCTQLLVPKAPNVATYELYKWLPTKKIPFMRHRNSVFFHDEDTFRATTKFSPDGLSHFLIGRGSMLGRVSVNQWQLFYSFLETMCVIICLINRYCCPCCWFPIERVLLLDQEYQQMLTRLDVPLLTLITLTWFVAWAESRYPFKFNFCTSHKFDCMMVTHATDHAKVMAHTKVEIWEVKVIIVKTAFEIDFFGCRILSVVTNFNFRHGWLVDL